MLRYAEFNRIYLLTPNFKHFFLQGQLISVLIAPTRAIGWEVPGGAYSSAATKSLSGLAEEAAADPGVAAIVSRWQAYYYSFLNTLQVSYGSMSSFLG
jgi:hypothetical protein